MNMVSQWVSCIVLHVTYQNIVPVYEVQGSIRSKFHVNRSEIPIATFDKIQPVFTIIACSIFHHSVHFHAQKSDGIVDQQVSLNFFGKMSTGYKFQA